MAGWEARSNWPWTTQDVARRLKAICVTSVSSRVVMFDHTLRTVGNDRAGVDNISGDIYLVHKDDTEHSQLSGARVVLPQEAQTTSSAGSSPSCRTGVPIEILLTPIELKLAR
jgi:hypothetical protein